MKSKLYRRQRKQIYKREKAKQNCCFIRNNNNKKIYFNNTDRPTRIFFLKHTSAEYASADDELA